jgi:hypothetical protein
MATVVNLDEFRASRSDATFGFLPYTFIKDGVGLIEGEHPIVVLTDPNNGDGICMSRECAKQLGAALLSVSDQPIPG